MNIRKATIDDIDSIMNVEFSSFIKEIQEDKNVFIERIKRCPSLFLIFEDDDKNIGGYLSSEIMTRVPETAKELELGHLPSKSEDKENTKKYIYISSFAILPKYRGSGIGKIMWNKSLEYFEKNLSINSFLLLVNEEWKGAFHIYESSGFSVVKEFPSFFYSNKKGSSSGILMVKE